MSYQHIANLYSDQRVLAFRELFALEKLHGTSAHVMWKDKQVRFFSGGAKQAAFESIFASLDMTALFVALGHDEVIIYGEAYGGSMQRMAETYGPELRFAVFEVKIGGTWLAVPNAEDVARKMGLEFVHYRLCSSTIEELNTERDAPIGPGEAKRDCRGQAP